MTNVITKAMLLYFHSLEKIQKLANFFFHLLLSFSFSSFKNNDKIFSYGH